MMLYFYFPLTALALYEVIYRRAGLKAYMTIALAGVFSIHTLYLLMHWVQFSKDGYVPLSGAAMVFGFLSWMLLGVATWLRTRFQTDVLSSLLLLAALFSMGGAVWIPGDLMLAVEKQSSFLFVVHVAILLISVGCFCVTVSAGTVYLFLQRDLKSKHFHRVTLLFPPLESLDRWIVKSSQVGFSFLTAGILTGIYMAHVYWRESWAQNYKVIFSIITWVWYLWLFFVRYRLGWRGSRFFALLVVGFVFLLFTFIVVNFYFV